MSDAFWADLQAQVLAAGLPPLPSHSLRVLVTGGRFYGDRTHVYSVLDSFPEIMVIGHGACRYGGADILAEDWAKSREVDYQGYSAKWKSESKSAGMKRNRRMFAWFQPHVTVAFPGHSGTADMVAVSRAGGVFALEAKP